MHPMVKVLKKNTNYKFFIDFLLPCGNLKLGNQHFWSNYVMPHDNQGLGTLD